MIIVCQKAMTFFYLSARPRVQGCDTGIATLLILGARLWTRDRRLAAASLRLGIAHPEE